MSSTSTSLSRFVGWAERPRVTPSWNAAAFLTYGGGDLHEPMSAAELRTLLTGGRLNGKILKRGDRVKLLAGIAYTSSAVSSQILPLLEGLLNPTDPASYVHVFSTGLASLPPYGRRVSDADLPAMAWFPCWSANVPSLALADGATGYRLSGLHVDPGPVTDTSVVVAIGPATPTSPDACPDWIILDRCHGTSTRANNSRRLIRLHSRTAIIQGCHLFNEPPSNKSDDQAIGGWNGIGPVLIDNNLLVAGSENIMFGGAPRAAGLGTTTVGIEDVTIRRNYIHKPETWNRHNLDLFDGLDRAIKNSFEVKCGGRVLLEHNLIRGCWPDAQGYTINLKCEGLGAHEATVDIIVQGNLFEHVANIGVVNTYGDVKTSRGCSRVEFVGNLARGLADARHPAMGSHLFRANADYVGFRQNTAISLQGLYQMLSLETVSGRHTGLRVLDNILHHQQYGVFGASGANASARLTAAYDDWQFAGNGIIAGRAIGIDGNAYPTSLDTAGFVDAAAYDYRLRVDSMLRGVGVDGGDPGADVDVVMAATAGAETGEWRDEIATEPAWAVLPEAVEATVRRIVREEMARMRLTLTEG